MPEAVTSTSARPRHIDVPGFNEAFAAQVVPCRDEWGIDPEKLNAGGQGQAMIVERLS